MAATLMMRLSSPIDGTGKEYGMILLHDTGSDSGDKP